MQPISEEAEKNSLTNRKVDKIYFMETPGGRIIETNAHGAFDMQKSFKYLGCSSGKIIKEKMEFLEKNASNYTKEQFEEELRIAHKEEQASAMGNLEPIPDLTVRSFGGTNLGNYVRRNG